MWILFAITVFALVFFFSSYIRKLAPKITMYSKPKSGLNIRPNHLSEGMVSGCILFTK
jgi:hypothetical protein